MRWMKYEWHALFACVYCVCINECGGCILFLFLISSPPLAFLYAVDAADGLLEYYARISKLIQREWGSETVDGVKVQRI